eukprot:NODE_4_length_77007_cov_1.156642.p23 type:complete len:357 gc:universal NODE_4_length_77007_cov_1.156642:21400-22470(+)
MILYLRSNDLRKYVIGNAVSISKYPNQPLPQFIIFAGENLFTYPKSNDSSVLLNVLYKNKTSELLELVIDNRPIPNAKGTTTLIFTNDLVQNYDNILNNLFNETALQYSLITNDSGLEIQGSSIYGSAINYTGKLEIAATNRNNATGFASIGFVRVDQYYANEWMILFVYLMVVALISWITVYFMGKPNHKIELTTYDTKRTRQTSSGDDRDSGFDIPPESTKAIKSEEPSVSDEINELTTDAHHTMLDLESQDDDQIKVENIKITPLSKYETIIGYEIKSEDISVSMVDGNELPPWMYLDHSNLLLLCPSMDDLGTFIVVVRKQKIVVQVLQIVVEYNFFDKYQSGVSDLSYTEI